MQRHGVGKGGKGGEYEREVSNGSVFLSPLSRAFHLGCPLPSLLLLTSSLPLRKQGYGQRPYDNWETVLFDCKDQDFKTVLAAIGSNNERWGINKVTLELRRPVVDA